MSKSTDVCSVPDCTSNVYGRALCIAHYTRNYRHGDPLGGTTGKGEPLEWLRAHVGHQGDDCLTWPYARGGKGEAVVHYEGRQQPAAAVMCRLVNGDKPAPDHEAAHHCGKGHEGCVHPGHVRWDTKSGNHMDRHEHGTMSRGETHRFSKLKEAEVHSIRASEKIESAKALAARFGVTTGTIYFIWKRKRWAWLN